MQTRKSFARIEREIKIAEAQHAELEQRARDRQQLRERALASARDSRYDGPSRAWHLYWRVIGLDDDELFAIRAEVILGESP